MDLQAIYRIGEEMHNAAAYIHVPGAVSDIFFNHQFDWPNPDVDDSDVAWHQALTKGAVDMSEWMRDIDVYVTPQALIADFLRRM